MKRIIITISSSIIVLILGVLLSLHLWIGGDVKDNIASVTQKYPGTTEEALIAYLLDENNSPTDRSHIAVWTMGQIQSQKALPVLRTYYKNDPEGKSCFEQHHTLLCQREIYKAIKAIEEKNLFAYSRLKNR